MPILVIGIGVGIVLIPLTLSVVAGARPQTVGPLTATSLVSQTLGGPLGLAAVMAAAEMKTRSILGPTFDSINREALTQVQKAAFGAGYTNSLLICAVLAAAIVLISITLVRFTPADIAEGKKAEKAAQSAPAED